MAIVIQNLMLATSGLHSSPEAIEVTSRLSGGTGAIVNAIHFGSEDADYQDKFYAPKLKINSISDEMSVKAMNRIISETPPDLLILPIKTDSGSAGLFTASEAIKIIDHYERMVLTVPCNGKKLDLTNIIVPIDTSFETRQKTPYALTLAKAFNSIIHIVGVSNDTGKDAEVAVRNYTRQVSNHIEEKGFRCTLDMQLGGNPTEKILEYAEQNNAGLIIIMTEQETGFTNFFKGKYSEQMIKNSPIPVLSIHPKDLVVSEARL